jgi:hypothetical protein
MVIVVVVAHCPTSGVKVYVVVVVLVNIGDQEPVTLLFDVVGNALNVAPEQIGDTAVKVGTTFALTVTTVGVEAADKHPFTSVTCTLYEPLVVALIIALVAPFDHK